MNIHVYLRGQVKPIQFYDTDAKSWYRIQVTESGALQIVRASETGSIVISAWNRGEWIDAYDVNYDPNTPG